MSMGQAQPRHHEAQQGWEQGLIGEGVLSEAFEALSPSVGGDGGELGKEQAHLGLGAFTERDEGEQEPVDAVELCGCERVLEVLEQCCDQVLFAVLCCLDVIIVDEIYPKRHFFLYPTDVPLSGGWEGGMLKNQRKDTYLYRGLG